MEITREKVDSKRDGGFRRSREIAVSHLANKEDLLGRSVLVLGKLPRPPLQHKISGDNRDHLLVLHSGSHSNSQLFCSTTP